MKKLPFLVLVLVLVLMAACKNKKIEQTEVAHSDTPEYTETQVDEKIDEQQKPEVLSSSIQNYKYSWTDSDQIPPVVIIIDDFGYINNELLDDFTRLPREVVFAVLPDLPHSAIAAQKAANTGHEVIIHVPMQAKTSNISPGERYIKEGMTYRDVEALLKDFYSSMPMAIAVNNHMGSTSTSDPILMDHVITFLEANKLGFVDSFTISSSVAFNLAQSRGLKSAKRDIFLDVPDNSDKTIISNIESLGKFKGRREPIVIITHCHNRDKLNALQNFIGQIRAMGIELIDLKSAMTLYPL